MKFIFNKKNLITIIIIIVIDIIIIGSWTVYFKPTSDIAIAYIYIILLVFSAHLVIAGIIYFIKKYYTPFFVLNAFVSSLMLYFFFVCYIEINTKKNYNEWEFVVNNENYDISYIAKDTLYFVHVSCGKYCYNGYDRGIVKEKSDTVSFLSVDSTHYYIYKDYLYNFKGIYKIRVKKRY